MFDALCRLLAALMRKPRSSHTGSKDTSATSQTSDHSDSEREQHSSSSSSLGSTPSFPLLHTPYSKKLILALHSLVSGQREHQRSFLQVTSRPRGHNEHTLLVYPLVRELNRAWVTSWLGATVPEMNPADGSDMYLKYARQWSHETSSGKGGGGGGGGSDEPSEEWEAETKRVRSIASEAYELYACIQLLLAALQFEFEDGTEEVRRALSRCSLETTVHEVAADVGGSAVYSLRVVSTFPENGGEGQGEGGGGAITKMAKAETATTMAETTTTDLDHPKMMVEVASGVVLQPCDAAVKRCARWYSIVMDECRELHLYHYDGETCVEALEVLGTTLRTAGSEAQHIFVNVHGALDQMIRNINQIDEKVMRAACGATSSLLHGSPMAQRAFLRHGGLNALSDCLSDYDVTIRSLALRSILIMIKGSRVSMNMSQNDRMRVVEDVRKCGVLDHVLNILNEFNRSSSDRPPSLPPSRAFRRRDSDMVDVAMQSASVLSYCVDDNVTNQQHVSSRGGMSTLRDVLRFCLSWRTSLEREREREEKRDDRGEEEERGSGSSGGSKEDQPVRALGDPSDPDDPSYSYDQVHRYDPIVLSELIENVSGALSNLAFRNQTNQDEMRRNGTLSLCVSALCRRVGIEQEFQGLNSVSEMLEQRREQSRRTNRERRERRERRRERRNQASGVSSTGVSSSYSDNSNGENDYDDELGMVPETDSRTGVTLHARLPCRPLALTTSLLNIIVNAVDANPLNQVAVGTRVTARLLTLFMGHGGESDEERLPLFDEDFWTGWRGRSSGHSSHSSGSDHSSGSSVALWTFHPSPMSLVVGMQKVSAMACLLASHLAWDNIVNQMHFGTLERVTQLLCLVETGSQFGRLLSVTSKGQAVLVKLPMNRSAPRFSRTGNEESETEEKKPDDGPPSAPPASSSAAEDSSAASAPSTSTTGSSSAITGSSSNISSAADHLLEQEDPTGRDGIRYLEESDGMMDSNQTSLGIFSVDQLGDGGSEEEVQLYALMALINMSYHNVAVHNLVHQAGGVETILHLLSSSAFDVRKAAIFCLGNVVTGHKVRGRLFFFFFFNRFACFLPSVSWGVCLDVFACFCMSLSHHISSVFSCFF